MTAWLGFLGVLVGALATIAGQAIIERGRRKSASVDSRREEMRQLYTEYLAVTRATNDRVIGALAQSTDFGSLPLNWVHRREAMAALFEGFWQAHYVVMLLASSAVRDLARENVIYLQKYADYALNAQGVPPAADDPSGRLVDAMRLDLKVS